MRKLSYVFGILSIVLIIIGFVLKINALAPASLLLAIGTLVFILGFAVPFTIDRLAIQSRRSLQISTIILTIFGEPIFAAQ